MALRQHDEELPPSRNIAATCTVAILRETLKGDDLSWFNDHVEDERYPATRLARVLRMDGHEVKSGVIQRHRRGECQCR